MTDFARPAKPTYRGAREHIELHADLTRSLKALSRQERVSLFMVLLAGFQCLLHRYSHHEEIGIASCAANRPLREVEGLMGRFGNDILLRTSLSANPTFRELLIRVRDTALTAYSDQNLPFGALLKDHANGTDPDRDTRRFRSCSFCKTLPKSTSRFRGCDMNWISLYTGTAKYDLNVWLKTEPTLEVILEYRTDLFRASTMKKILEDYHVILENAVNDPGARIHKLIARKSEPPQVSSLAPAPAVLESKNGAAPPKDDLQSRLVEVWEEIFDLRPIGVDHDFFELGGDSLLGARLFTRIEATFKIEFAAGGSLEAPTIRQLAAIISGRKKLSSGSSTTESNPVS